MQTVTYKYSFKLEHSTITLGNTAITGCVIIKDAWTQNYPMVILTANCSTSVDTLLTAINNNAVRLVIAVENNGVNKLLSDDLYVIIDKKRSGNGIKTNANIVNIQLVLIPAACYTMTQSSGLNKLFSNSKLIAIIQSCIGEIKKLFGLKMNLKLTGDYNLLNNKVWEQILIPSHYNDVECLNYLIHYYKLFHSYTTFFIDNMHFSEDKDILLHIINYQNPKKFIPANLKAGHGILTPTVTFPLFDTDTIENWSKQRYVHQADSDLITIDPKNNINMQMFGQTQNTEKVNKVEVNTIFQNAQYTSGNSFNTINAIIRDDIDFFRKRLTNTYEFINKYPTIARLEFKDTLISMYQFHKKYNYDTKNIKNVYIPIRMIFNFIPEDPQCVSKSCTAMIDHLTTTE